jgi:lipopolysaccharide/colanic/teichoic acid biosynthesis glycosyltransferase
MSSVDAPLRPKEALLALTELMHPVDPAAMTVRLYRAGGKRTLDVVMSSLLLVALSPVLVVAGALVMWDLGRPVFFIQARTGLQGQPFRMRKFRTMRPDRRTTLTAPPANHERRSVIPSSCDPRLTDTGRLLSRTSIDELPQLIHVLTGNMSLVGPRPDYVFRIDAYCGAERRRFDVPGGMTGPWQVLAGTSTDLHEYVEVDLMYVDRYSMMNDLRLLAATPRSAVRRALGRRTP